MTAVIAHGIGNVECKVIATLLGSDLQQVQILLLGQMLVQIHVKGGAASEVLDIGTSMQLELVDHTERVVLNNVEV